MLGEGVALSAAVVKNASHFHANVLQLLGKVDKTLITVYNYTYQEAIKGKPGPLERIEQ